VGRIPLLRCSTRSSPNPATFLEPDAHGATPRGAVLPDRFANRFRTVHARANDPARRQDLQGGPACLSRWVRPHSGRESFGMGEKSPVALRTRLEQFLLVRLRFRRYILCLVRAPRSTDNAEVASSILASPTAQPVPVSPGFCALSERSLREPRTEHPADGLGLHRASGLLRAGSAGNPSGHALACLLGFWACGSQRCAPSTSRTSPWSEEVVRSVSWARVSNPAVMPLPPRVVGTLDLVDGERQSGPLLCTKEHRVTIGCRVPRAATMTERQRSLRLRWIRQASRIGGRASRL